MDPVTEQQPSPSQDVFEGVEAQPLEQPAEQQAAPAPASTGLSRDDIQSIITGALTASAPKPAQQERQYTQEEFEKAFNVVKPTEDQIATIQAGGAPALKVLTELLHGSSKHAISVSHYQQQQLRDELMQQLNPALSFVKAQQEERLKTEFYRLNADLKDYEPIIDQVVAQMKASGYTAPDIKTAFAEVVRRTREIIAKIPGITPSQQGSPANGQAATGTTQPKAQQTSRMSTLNTGGQGGVGGSSTKGGAGKQRSGMEIFD